MDTVLYIICMFRMQIQALTFQSTLWSTPIQGRFSSPVKHTEDGTQNSVTDPIKLNGSLLLIIIIIMLKEVQLTTSPKSQTRQWLKRRTSSMETPPGHTTSSQRQTKQASFRASLTLSWETFSAGRSKSKNTNGLRQQRCRLRGSIHGRCSLPTLMSLIRSIVTVICVAIFV